MGGSSEVSLGFFVVGKSSQNSPKPVLIFWSSRSYAICNLFVYTLLKVAKLSFECSVHVSDGFQKQSLDGLRMSSIQFYFGFLTLMQSP